VKYQLQIVKHPAREAVLPFTYPEALEADVAALRLASFNALPGFRGRLVDAPIPSELCGIRGCVFLPHDGGPHSWTVEARS